MYSDVTENDIQFFIDTLGSDFVMSKLEDRENFGHDETEDFVFPPQVVLLPRNTSEVSKILKYCNDRVIAVTPIGAQTGLSGGALSVVGGVGLSMKRFDSIINIDTDNLQVTVEPGVITEVLQNEVEKHGLYYPPDPASKGSCFIGGNIAENSGGPHAVKYGVTSDFVLNLEVVLPNGDVIWTGANTLKNSTGYNLTQLFVGSEGTLGVLTKAVLRLIPKPTLNALMLVPFESASDACNAVAAIFKAGITPSAMEFMERDAIEMAANFTKTEFDLKNDENAHLLIEVDGFKEDYILEDCERISSVLEGFNAGEILFANDQTQKDKLWFLRRRVGEAVKSFSVYKEEDTVVPRFQLAKLLEGVKQIGNKFGFQSVCYGHAGDGNLHVNILKGDLSDQDWNENLDDAIREIFELCVELKGTISGEHGIGYVQKKYMNIPFSNIELELMWRIKKVYDSKLIMNPNKVFPVQFYQTVD